MGMACWTSVSRTLLWNTICPREVAMKIHSNLTGAKIIVSCLVGKGLDEASHNLTPFPCGVKNNACLLQH